jgi:nuclear GTP-binding protein
MQEDATEHVPQVLERVRPEYLRRAYRLGAWENATDFLEQLARSTGRLPGGTGPPMLVCVCLLPNGQDD